ncbi:MAG: protein kinase, partial [Pseudomonadota bacterium]
MPSCPTCNGRFVEGAFCPKDGTPLSPDEKNPNSSIGQIVGGRYRLTKLLGQGGMGEVYSAEHVHITKTVAVKLLHPQIGNNAEAVARFRLEAQSASSIGHRNIVVIDDFGTMENGRVYLCMEYLEGKSLAELMQTPGGISLCFALNIMCQVCDGLTVAHAKNIVHRDMKPENIFISVQDDGQPVAKILDFGIAKVSGTDENQSLTRTGTVFGTPHYMSPEQALGQKVDYRADIYSAGVILFEIITGQVPFKAESFMGILSQHIVKQPPPFNTVSPDRTPPPSLEAIVFKAMDKDPKKRFSSMAELKMALLQVLSEIRDIPDAKSLLGGTLIAPADRPATIPASDRLEIPIPKTIMAGELVAPVPAPNKKSGPPTKTKRKPGFVIAIASAFLVLAGGLAVAFYWDNLTNKKSSLAPKSTAMRDKTKIAMTSPNTMKPNELPNQGPAQDMTEKVPEETLPHQRNANQPSTKKTTPRSEKTLVGDESARNTPAAVRALPPATEPDANATPPAQKITNEEKVPPKALPPSESHHTILLVTIPPGARVFENNRPLSGRTPIKIKIQAGEERRFKIAKGGYVDKCITIPACDNVL